jgi:hypothetical protein
MKQKYLSVLGARLWNNRLVLMLLLLQVDRVGEVVGLGAGLAIKRTHPKKNPPKNPQKIFFGVFFIFLFFMKIIQTFLLVTDFL